MANTPALAADTITRTFNLAAIAPQVNEGFRFMVALPFNTNGRESYLAWASTPERQESSTIASVPNTILPVEIESVLFKNQKDAQDFCDAQKDNTSLAGRLSVVTLSYSQEADRLVATPPKWSEDKAAAIARMARK